jgi:flagellar motility protein MotE (MotC chaperone)
MDESVRVLRVVMVSAVILFGVKMIDILNGHNALAEDHGPAHADAPPKEASAVKIAKPDASPEAKHEAKTDGPKAELPPQPVAEAPPDISNMSRSEVEVLQNLAARRQELDARGREIDMREKLLKASEQRIDERIAELKGIESNIQSLLQQRDQAQETELLSLVKVYEGMKPADAARIFDKLDMDILLPVAQRMKPPKISPVLAAMDADAAKRLTTNLARHLGAAKAPETAPAAAPAAPVSSQGG